MPARNSRKQYAADSFYHLYNRGVERRIIYSDPQDYGVFTSYLKTYLLPKDTAQLQSIIADPTENWREKGVALKLLRLNNFADSLDLIAYCLMPNHFHLLVKQREENTIDRFMNSLCTRYTMYFNRKHKRVGTLFQGVYKAVLVESDEQLVHLTRYIHSNPALQGEALKRLRSYRYSSYQAFLSSAKINWLHQEYILPSFSSSGYNSYQSFVESNESDELGDKLIADLLMDED